MMKSEIIKDLKSSCLGLMSLGFLIMPQVIRGMSGVPKWVHNEYQDFFLLFWLASIAVGIPAIITGRSAKVKMGVAFGMGGAGLATLLLLGSPLMFLETISDGRIHCSLEMQELSNATLKYCEQNEGILPDADTWCDQLIGSAEHVEEYYSQKFLVGGHDLAGVPEGRISNFAYNKNLEGYKTSEIDRSTVFLFETDEGWNQNGTSAILLSEAHPGYWPFCQGGYHFIFVGPGSTFTVKFIKNSEFDSLNWTPK